MTVIQGALLGLIQGLGEFLPISSSGHLLLARIIMNIDGDGAAMKMLDILMHVGTLIPVAIIFWKEWMDMLRHPVRNRTLLMLIIASLPTLLVYIAAKKLISLNGYEGFAVFDNGWFLGVSFLITAVFLLLCDWIVRRRKGNQGTKEVGILSAIVMGFFQGIGMLPGVSRSGSTILGGVSTGLDKDKAARFSFMMSAPAILGSMLMEGKDALEDGHFDQIAVLPSLAGIAVAAVTGYLAIRFMLRIISKIHLGWFSLYLAVLGIVFLVLQFTGASGIPAFAVPAAESAAGSPEAVSAGLRHLFS